MCLLLDEKTARIWNFEWVQNKDLKSRLMKYSILNKPEIATLKPFIERSEFDAFWKGYD